MKKIEIKIKYIKVKKFILGLILFIKLVIYKLYLINFLLKLNRDNL